MSAYSAAVQADAPRLFWRLNESSGGTAFDSSGNALGGTYGNTPLLGQPGPIWSDGAENLAVQFRKAQSEYVSRSTDALLDIGGTGSLECWIKRQALFAATSYQTIFHKGTNPPELQFRDNDGLYLNKGGVNLICHSPPVTDLLGWHHFVATFVPGSGKMYMDGVDVTIADTAQTCSDSATGPFVAAPNFAEALIARFALYATELSADRVLAHYEAAFLPQEFGGTSSHQVIKRKEAVGY